MNELDQNTAYQALLKELVRLQAENETLKQRIKSLKSTSSYEDSYTRDFNRDRHDMGG